MINFPFSTHSNPTTALATVSSVKSRALLSIPVEDEQPQSHALVPVPSALTNLMKKMYKKRHMKQESKIIAPKVCSCPPQNGSKYNQTAMKRFVMCVPTKGDVCVCVWLWLCAYSPQTQFPALWLLQNKTWWISTNVLSISPTRHKQQGRKIYTSVCSLLHKVIASVIFCCAEFIGFSPPVRQHVSCLILAMKINDVVHDLPYHVFCCVRIHTQFKKHFRRDRETFYVISYKVGLCL